MTSILADARDQLGAIRRIAEDLADQLDDFRPTGPLQHLDVTSARSYVAAVTAALDRLEASMRRDLT